MILDLEIWGSKKISDKKGFDPKTYQIKNGCPKNPFSLFLVGNFFLTKISWVEMNFYNLQRKISVLEKIALIIFLMSKQIVLILKCLFKNIEI